MKTNFGIFVLAASLCSCTNQQLYDSVQNNNVLECNKLQMAQREDCLKRIAPSYDKYEAERQKLLKKQD